MKKCFFYYFATLFLMFSNTSYAIVLNQKDSSLKTITPLSCHVSHNDISHKKPSFFQRIVFKIAEKRLKKLSKRSNTDEVSSQGDKAVLITVWVSSGLALLFYLLFLINILLSWFYLALGVLLLGGLICSLLLLNKNLNPSRRKLAKFFALFTILTVICSLGLVAIISSLSLNIF